MKKINGFENYYITKDGQVLSDKSGVLKELTPTAHTRGYLKIDLCIAGVKHQLLIHRLVALAYCKNPLNKPMVDHINGIKTDNRAENLRFCTNQENISAYWEMRRNLKTA